MNTKMTKQLLLAILALAFTACSEHILEQQASSSSSVGHSAMVRLNVSTVPEEDGTLGTRAIDPNDMEEGTAAGYKVNDFWLLEYGADGKLMGDEKGGYVAKYIVMSELEKKGNRLVVQLPNKGSNDKYKCVMVANTHNSALFAASNVKQCESLDELKKICKDINTADDTYAPSVQGKKKELYLSCTVEVLANSTILDCKFHRNVAKLTLQLKSTDKSGMRITGVQIGNVPDKIAYFDHLYEENGNADKFASGAKVKDFPKEDVNITPGNSKTLLYYLPRNCQGRDGSITDVKNKNKSGMKASATYVKVFATEIKTDHPYCYTFYVGEDMMKDFNVRPNYHYTLPVTISGPGNVTVDPRVEDLGPVEIKSNSGMLDLNDKNQAYVIYPYKRINKFWNLIKSKDTRAAEGRIIDDNYQWEAVIIWQDIDANVIGFGDSGTEHFEGTGKTPLKIKLKNSITKPCNVLIGVKKRGWNAYKDGYLWSWHLWVTPYKPNRKEPWVDGKYEYTEGVTSGSVFRYDAYKGKEENRPDIKNSVWTPGGLYYNKYIMDRNLGARTFGTPTQNDDLELSRGLYYQYGRTAPFAAKPTRLYKGEYTEMRLSEPAKKLFEVVKWPDWFYKMNTPIGQWWIENDYEKNDWFNPFPGEAEFSKKTFFDPCPDGWCLPERGVWNVFTTDSNPRQNTERGFFVHAVGSFIKGWNFKVGYNTATTTFYPAGGVHIQQHNRLYNRWDLPSYLYGGNYGAYWSRELSYYTHDLANGFRLLFCSKYVVPVDDNMVRDILTNCDWNTNGQNVRCIQE